MVMTRASATTSVPQPTQGTVDVRDSRGRGALQTGGARPMHGIARGEVGGTVKVAEVAGAFGDRETRRTGSLKQHCARDARQHAAIEPRRHPHAIEFEPQVRDRQPPSASCRHRNAPAKNRSRGPRNAGTTPLHGGRIAAPRVRQLRLAARTCATPRARSGTEPSPPAHAAATAHHSLPQRRCASFRAAVALIPANPISQVAALHGRERDFCEQTHFTIGTLSRGVVKIWLLLASKCTPWK